MTARLLSLSSISRARTEKHANGDGDRKWEHSCLPLARLGLVRTQKESKRERGTHWRGQLRARWLKLVAIVFVQCFFRAERAGSGGRYVCEQEGDCEVRGYRGEVGERVSTDRGQ